MSVANFVLGPLQNPPGSPSKTVSGRKRLDHESQLWKEPEPHPVLADGELHVWQVKLDRSKDEIAEFSDACFLPTSMNEPTDSTSTETGSSTSRGEVFYAASLLATWPRIRRALRIAYGRARQTRFVGNSAAVQPGALGWSSSYCGGKPQISGNRRRANPRSAEVGRRHQFLLFRGVKRSDRFHPSIGSMDSSPAGHAKRPIGKPRAMASAYRWIASTSPSFPIRRHASCGLRMLQKRRAVAFHALSPSGDYIGVVAHDGPVGSVR